MKFKEMTFQEQQDKYGCVMRGLESITRARATDEEWRLRLDQVTSRHDYSEKEKRAVLVEKDLDVALDLISKGLQRDLKERLPRLFAEIGTHQTPLGQTLGGYDISQRSLDRNQLFSTLEEGKKVMATAFVAFTDIESGEICDVGLHTFHVVNDPEKGLVDASGGHGKVELPEGTEIPCFVFSPKAWK